MSDSLTISMATACRRYDVSRLELLKLMERGFVPYVKLGQRILIMRPFADAHFMKSQAETVSAEEQLSFAL